MAQPRGGKGKRGGPTNRRSAPSSRLGSKRAAPPKTRTKTSRPAPSRTGTRLGVVFVAICVAFAGLAVRLVMLQIVDAPAYARIAADQREREILFPARRGTIFDRSGEPLAISVDLHTIYTDPKLVEDVEAEAAKLAPVLDQKTEAVAANLAGSEMGDRFEYLARQVEPTIADRVEELDLPGVFMRPEAKRYYPNDRLASHILGFADVDGKGVAGIELQYEDILRGQPGRMILEQNPAGIALPQAEFTYERPRPGRALVLTIDKELQYFTELTLERATLAYNAKAATAVIMRPDTGEILAMATVPDFDPNNAGDSPTAALRNRAVVDTYEPGSIFKAVTVSGVLEEALVTPRTKFVVPDEMAYIDRVFHDSHAHPTEEMSTAEIIKDSSNVGTIQLGLKLGAQLLDHYVHEFGFGTPTGLDFPGEVAGQVLPLEDWSGTTVATVPIGQGIAVTAIQMASAYSTLANDGVWVEPKLLSGTMTPDGDLTPSPQPTAKRVVSRKVAGQVTKMLVSVVKDGTGTEGQIPGYKVAGKTGTAQKALPTGGYGDEYVGSFAGFAPANDPKIVMIVSFDEPDAKYGGVTAAPTFATIAEFALRRMGVPPNSDAARAAAAVRDDEAEPAHD